MIRAKVEVRKDTLMVTQMHILHNLGSSRVMLDNVDGHRKTRYGFLDGLVQKHVLLNKVKIIRYR